MDKGKNLRYSEHSGLLDFNKHNLEKNFNKCSNK